MRKMKHRECREFLYIPGVDLGLIYSALQWARDARLADAKDSYKKMVKARENRWDHWPTWKELTLKAFGEYRQYSAAMDAITKDGCCHRLHVDKYGFPYIP